MPVQLLASVTVTVKLNEPTVVGRPDTNPVVGFKLNPAGKAPAVTANVNDFVDEVMVGVVGGGAAVVGG